jgi:hypothetical protein
MPPTPSPDDEHLSNSSTTANRSPLKFFLLVFALSVPFWVLGAVTGLQLLPGLPVSSLMVFSPLLAASILVYRENKAEGVKALLRRSFDYPRLRAKTWYIPIIFLMPAIMVMTYGLMRLTDFPLPRPQFPVLTALALLLASFVAALGEELGWTGYIMDPLQDRWYAVQAGIILGLVWALWHIIPLMQAHRSLAWIACWSLGTVAARILYVWLYNNTGKSVFAAALFHATGNVSWLLFPNLGSHYDPCVTGLVILGAAAAVAIAWGPRTLARHRP